MDAYLKNKPDAKVICDCCDWKGRVADLLIVRRPTRNKPNLYGCPKCNNYDCIDAACAANGCWSFGNHGAPFKIDGQVDFMRFCGEHCPRKQGN